MSTSKEPKVGTQCKKCNRVVFTIHVNADGVCVLCAPADKLTSKPKPKKS